MTKQETIKNHYITEFINSGMSEQEAEQKWEHSEEFINPDDGYFQNREEYYRPISLRGIETNNSWTAILSEKDLPSADIDCWLELTNGRVLLAIFHFERQIFFGFNFPYTINEVIAYSEIKQPPKRIY